MFENVYEDLITSKLEYWYMAADWFYEQGNDSMGYCIKWAGENNKYPYATSLKFVSKYAYFESKDYVFDKKTRFYWLRLDGPRTDKIVFKETNPFYRHSIPVGVASYMWKLGVYKNTMEAFYTSAEIAWKTLADGLDECRKVVNV